MGCASSKAPSNVEAEQAAAKPTGAVEGGSGAAVYGGDVKSDAPKAGVVVKRATASRTAPTIAPGFEAQVGMRGSASSVLMVSVGRMMIGP